MQDASETGCTIDDCRLMQCRIYAGQGTDIDDRTPAHTLPYTRPDKKRVEIRPGSHEEDFFTAKQFNKIVDQNEFW